MLLDVHKKMWCVLIQSTGSDVRSETDERAGRLLDFIISCGTAFD